VKSGLLFKVIIFSVFAFMFSSCEKDTDEELLASSEKKDASFHIGVVTGTFAQSEDEQLGALAMIAKYGDANEGGMIRHLNYPDNFMQEKNKTIEIISSFADDPLIKVVVVNSSIPGTAEAFSRIKRKRDDVLCFAANSQEAPSLISGIADLVVDPDSINRGYLIPIAAKRMGAKNFVHLSFPRHLDIELVSLRARVMEATCKRIGIGFFMEEVPDPMSHVGISGAKEYITRNMQTWIDKYGVDTAFFATNDAQTEPLLKKVAEVGAIFVEQDLPSPILGYSPAFNIDTSDLQGNWKEILKRVEATVLKNGGKDRMGSWAYSYGYTTTQALVEYGRQIVEGSMQTKNLTDVLKAYSIFTPGANWNGSCHIDLETKEKKENHVLVYQDTYVFGKGFLDMTEIEVPDVYSLLESN